MQTVCVTSRSDFIGSVVSVASSRADVHGRATTIGHRTGDTGAQRSSRELTVEGPVMSAAAGRAGCGERVSSVWSRGSRSAIRRMPLQRLLSSSSTGLRLVISPNPTFADLSMPPCCSSVQSHFADAARQRSMSLGAPRLWAHSAKRSVGPRQSNCSTSSNNGASRRSVASCLNLSLIHI